MPFQVSRLSFQKVLAIVSAPSSDSIYQSIAAILLWQQPIRVQGTDSSEALIAVVFVHVLSLSNAIGVSLAESGLSEWAVYPKSVSQRL